MEYAFIIPIIIGVLSVVSAIIAIWLSNPINKGAYGEYYVSRKLKGLSDEYMVINDLLLPSSQGTTQIDHVVVSPYGIFVIETKNYKGWIYGNEQSEKWIQSLISGRRYGYFTKDKYPFRNPICQNRTHVNAVKALICSIGDFKIIPIVAFSDDATLCLTCPNYIVIHWAYLKRTIQLYNEPCISPEDVQRITEILLSVDIKEEGSREKHVEHVHNIEAQQMAKLHAKEMSIANRVCPKCGGMLIDRTGKYGTFLGCSNYPNCSFTHKY